MKSESNKIEQIVKNMSNGQQSENRIFYDEESRKIQTESDGAIEITPEDLTFAGA
ncbi:MAG: hypothetical protein PF503_04385 [Desulfobacula sp.]|jgi:hypothetical protein|nr:hypothetical protein [Desulfobacula sp.]